MRKVLQIAGIIVVASLWGSFLYFTQIPSPPTTYFFPSYPIYLDDVEYWPVGEEPTLDPVEP